MPNFGYVKTGYSPVAGEWYDAKETPIPRVYHAYAKQDIL